MALHRNDPQVEGKDACYRCVTKPMETLILLSSCYTEILEAGKNYRGVRVGFKVIHFEFFSFLCFRLSRKILWLELATINNDPSVVLSFYLRTVFQLEGLLLCITDMIRMSQVDACSV